MGKPVARIGDKVQGRCHHGYDDCPHDWSGSITTGADSDIVEGSPIARIGDKVEHSCPHCGYGDIIAGSNSVLGEGQGVAHLGDKIISPGGQGEIVAGAQSTIAD